MPRTTRRILVLVALVLAARPVAADDQAGLEHPLAGSKLVLGDGAKPAQRRIVFSARFKSGAAMGNPTFAGSTLRVYGTNPSDGDTGVIDLDQAKWHALGKPAGSKGYAYRDPSGSVGGIELVVVKLGKRAGVFRLVGGKGNWRYGIAGPQGDITITFTVGKARWCAVFTQPSFKTNVAHRVFAKSKDAPASCPCDRFTSTFGAIQAAIFERHQCTQAACHGSSPGQGNLDLRADVSYANLVGVPSVGEPDKQRVAIGLARDSELWRKLAAATQNLSGVAGQAMPSGGLPPLTDNELEMIRLWIHDGAPATGIVLGTDKLLGSCPLDADPIKITPPPVPAPDQGIQLHAPPWKIPPRDPAIPGHDGEDEVCYATWYDFSAQIPDADRAPCPDVLGGPTKDCFFYNRSDLTQDPDSHHSIIHLYKGAYDITDDIYTCAGGSNAGKPCSASPGGDCPGGACQGRPAFGPFACLGGPNEGLACDPKGIGTPAPAGADCGAGGGCAGRVQTSIACIFYGPPDFGFDVTGTGTDNSPAIGGSQQPVSHNDFPSQVFAMLPVKGTIVWNSHAFNLTDKLATNEQWLNLFFAPPPDRIYPVRGIFDAKDIFVEDVPVFEKREYCRTYTLPQHARLFQFSSHTHKRGELFRIWGPGITDVCGSEPGKTPPASCPPESGPPIFTTTVYNDPEILTFDPPVALDGVDDASRTYKFCSRYDNGADVPSEVKRQSTSPLPPLFPGLETLVGGPCPDTTVACLDGPHKGELCHGDDAACGGTPGACDACPVHGGVTTEDEMFILLGFYYVVP